MTFRRFGFPAFLFQADDGGGSTEEAGVDTGSESSSIATPEVISDIAASLGLASKEPEEKQTPEEEASVAEAKPDETAKPDTPDPLAEAPKTWRKEAAAEWAKIPPTVRDEILKREADMFKGIEGYKSDAAVGQGFKSVLSPFMDQIRAANANPMEVVGGLLTTHSKLLTMPLDQRAALFERVAGNYGVKVKVVSADEPDEEQRYVDPDIARLNKTVEDLRRDTEARRAAEVAQIEASNKKAVDEFAANPANIYFNEVADDIAYLIKTGKSGSLQEAYDMAVRLNPVTFAKESARIAAEAADKARKEMAAKAKQARAATSANLSTRPNNGVGTGPVKSWQEGLEEAYAAIQARG